MFVFGITNQAKNVKIKKNLLGTKMRIVKNISDETHS